MLTMLCSCNWQQYFFKKTNCLSDAPGPSSYTFYTSHSWQCKVWKRHQKEDLLLCRDALTFGIEQHTGWVHRYSQSQDCVCCADATSRPSAHGENQLDRTDTGEGEFEWLRAEPLEDLTQSLQVVKVPKAVFTLIPHLTGSKHHSCMCTVVHSQAWTLTWPLLFSAHFSSHATTRHCCDRIIEYPELEGLHQDH